MSTVRKGAMVVSSVPALLVGLLLVVVAVLGPSLDVSGWVRPAYLAFGVVYLGVVGVPAMMVTRRGRAHMFARAGRDAQWLMPEVGCPGRSQRSVAPARRVLRARREER